MTDKMQTLRELRNDLMEDDEYLAYLQMAKEDDSCRPTCAARRNPNAECVCAELDALNR